MFTIAKQFPFAASHQLTGLPDGHQCARLHGHNYVAELVLAAPGVDEVGMVRDYGDLDIFADWVKGTVDHRHLNDLLDENPTAEHLARWLYQTAHQLGLAEVVAVRVAETPKTWAEYHP